MTRIPWMDKTPSSHYNSHLGYVGGYGRQDATNNLWQLANSLAFRVLQRSAEDIYEHFYRNLSSGKFLIAMFESPTMSRERRHLLEGPPPSFSPVSEERKQALLELVCPGSNIKPEVPVFWWNPYFKRPGQLWSLPISSPEIESLDIDNGNDGLGEPEPYMQARALESLVPEGLELEDGQSSLPADIGNPLELQPGDGGVGGSVPSPETSASRPSGVGAHEGIKATPDGVGIGAPPPEGMSSLENPADQKFLKRRLSNDESSQVIPKQRRAKNSGTLRCEFSDSCPQTFVTTANRARHHKTQHKAEYERLQLANLIPKRGGQKGSKRPRTRPVADEAKLAPQKVAAGLESESED